MKPISSEKPDNAYCCWCGRYRKYMMPKNQFGEVVCPVCFEDDHYIEHVSRLERHERTTRRQEIDALVKRIVG